MFRIALQMLVGDKSRYIGILMGIAFSCLVISQQSSIFCGIMLRTIGFLTDTSLPDIWVMDPKVQYIDDLKPMQDTQLLRVRGVEGVEWAVPLYRGLLRARLGNGNFQSSIVVGLDDATLIGAPPIMEAGKLEDLRQADGVIVDKYGAEGKLAAPSKVEGGKGTPLGIGDLLEINDQSARVVGIAKTSRTFQAQPVIYTTYTRARGFAPKERKLMSFVLVKAKPGLDVAEVASQITERTGLAALTSDDFKKKTFFYFLKYTGIPINFGIAVLLGLIVGTAIAGQTFYNFTLDNLRYLGALKAMGASNWLLLGMIVLQALVVGLIGYGLGIGLASLFYYLSLKSELAFFMPWQLPLIVGGLVILICVIAAAISVVKVMRLEPAAVFRS